MGQDYCDKCNNTGLLPFKRKDGSIVPNAFLDCECKIKMREQEQDHFREIKPEDFDFAMSDDFRESTFELYGQPWEQRPKIYQPEESPVVAEPQPWTQRQQYQLDQTRSELISIRRTLQERDNKKLEIGKAQQPPQKSTYKGLVVNNERDKI